MAGTVPVHGSFPRAGLWRDSNDRRAGQRSRGGRACDLGAPLQQEPLPCSRSSRALYRISAPNVAINRLYVVQSVLLHPQQPVITAGF